MQEAYEKEYGVDDADFKIGIDAPHSNHIDVKEYAVSQVDETTEGENVKNYSCILSNFQNYFNHV